MRKIENLEKLMVLLGYSRHHMFYDMQEKKLYNDFTCLFSLKETAEIEESKIVLFYGTPNEITIYDHELDIIFYSDNIFLMQYKNSIIIFFSPINEFMENLIEEHKLSVTCALDNIECENEKDGN